MREIYIKGLKIPIDNTVLIRVFPASENGECYVQQLDVDGDILDELWAVPIPPHGDLIDRDALMKGEGRYIISFGKEGIDVAEINRAPTIIPASE